MITLRPLTIWDSAFCYRLACDPVARANSFDPNRPTLIGHLRWMWRCTRHLAFVRAWVIEVDSEARRRHGLRPARVGAVVVQHTGPFRAEISINIAKPWRGRGFGPIAIRDASAMAARMWACRIWAAIKPDNKASQRAFSKAGYTSLQITGNMVRMQYVQEVRFDYTAEQLPE